MLDPNYIVGFVDGEGCFSITINRNSTMHRPEVRLVFEIELEEDDGPILRSIQEVIDCGNIYRFVYKRFPHWKPHYKYKVSNFKDIYGKVIPFFRKYPLQAKKKFSFEKFCQAAELIKEKKHLTLEGVERIKKIRHKDSLDALDAHVQWGVAKNY